MIKKSIFEQELIAGMQKQLIKQAKQENYDHLEKAADYLNSAAEIFQDMGMIKNADKILSILSKIAETHKPHDPRKVPDHHTKGLTNEKMVKNLEHHGHPMNMADDGNLADQEIEDVLEVSDNFQELHDFEDEI
jgi:hypothetical protein